MRRLWAKDGPADPFESAEMAATLGAMRGLVRRRLSDAPGAHLAALAGRALDFREHRAYAIGDDARAIDWRASARRPDQEWLVRVFDAEKSLSLAVLLDAGPTMRCPIGDDGRLTKLRVAGWVARALARLVVKSPGDRLHLAAIGDGAPPSLRLFQTAPGGARAVAFSDAVAEAASRTAPGDAGPEPSADQLARTLPPRSVVVVASDFFPDVTTGAPREPTALIELLRLLQRRRHVVVAFPLDSWPLESAILQESGVRFAPVGGMRFGDAAVRLSTGEARAVAAEMARRWEATRAKAELGALLWPKRPFEIRARRAGTATALELADVAAAFPAALQAYRGADLVIDRRL